MINSLLCLSEKVGEDKELTLKEVKKKMEPRIDDKNLFQREIRKLEMALISVSDNLVLATSSSNHFEIFKKVEEPLKVELNSAKLEFECNFGVGRWLLDPQGFRV